MTTLFPIIAETGLTWTVEMYYLAAAVLQVVVILVAFRVMNLPAEYNTFPHAALVVVGTNAVAYFTKGLGLVGILLTTFTLFLLLVAVARGDVLKSAVVWALVLVAYWGTAWFVVDYEEALISDQLGSVPHMLLEAEMEAEPMTEETYEELRESGDD